MQQCNSYLMQFVIWESKIKHMEEIDENPEMGRPSLYRPEYAQEAEKLCLIGATDIQIADFFGVTERTLYRWKHDHADFCQALKVGKEEADKNVERSLYRKATGYEYESEKILVVEGEVVRVPTREFVPPSDTAMIFWLKNRKPKEWRDKADIGVSGSLNVACADAKEMSTEELRAFLAQKRAENQSGE